MKIRTAVVLLVGCSLGASWSAWSRPVDLSAPEDELGAANLRGYLEVWREVEGVGLQLGKNSYLALRYKFSTETDKAGLLGAGFYLPMFEARNVLLRESTMRAYLPCGKGLYLWRTSDNPDKFETPDKEWTGYLKGDNFTVSRDDGWRLSYQNGRLSSITSDDNHTFSWSYDHAGGGSVEQDGKPVIKLEAGPGGQVADIVFGGKTYNVEYGKRPILGKVDGQALIKDLVPALSKFKFPNGNVQTFDFSLTEDNQLPILAATEVDGTVSRYAWDSVTRHITKERTAGEEWTYQIGNTDKEFALPVILRTDNRGGREERTIDDTAMTYTVQASGGEKTVTHLFDSPGPLYHKVRYVESTIDGLTKTVYKASYDETGQLLRDVDRRGFVTNYQYDKNKRLLGTHVTLTADPTFLKKLADEEKVLLTSLTEATTNNMRDEALNELYIFYVAEKLDYAKAEELLKLMTNREQVYNLKLSLATNPNNGPTKQNEMLAALTQEFPDKQAYTELHLSK